MATETIYDPGGCVGPCPMGCIGTINCPQCRYTYTVCDVCGRETDGEDICDSCLAEIRQIEEEEENGR